MSKIHYFQRYSQKENAVTNNTLLLLSRLYEHSPLRFEEFLQETLDGIEIEIGVSFIQQQATKKRTKKISVPDGRLAQSSFRVVVETKLGDKFDSRQITGHLAGFGTETTKVLLLLSPGQMSLGRQEQIKKVVRSFNERHQVDVQVVQTTFEDLIAHFDHVLQQRDHEMRDLLQDYQAFCDDEGLLPGGEYTMRAVACGMSIDENIKFRLYYDPVDRSYRSHRFLGIYSDKCIQAVGAIQNIVQANLVDGHIEVINSTEPVTQEQRSRISQVIPHAKKFCGYDIRRNHQFFLVDHLHPTDYRKVSKGPMMSTKYFNLKEILGVEELPEDTEKIAALLRDEEW